MANFMLAAARTGRNEGGYTDNPADAGGETFCGISRVNWPDWIGWQKLDAMPREQKYMRETLGVMRQWVDDFYKTNFWDVNCLDDVADQVTAESVYDCGVLFGVGQAAAWAQRILNCMNAGGVRWPDLAVDGRLGRASVACLNVACSPHDVLGTRMRFLSVMAAMRIAQHVLETEKRPKNEDFFDGWCNRAIRMETGG